MPSPVEIRQLAYQAAADYLEGVESNVIDRQVIHQCLEKVIEAIGPYLCSDEPVAPTERKRRRMPWLW